VQVCAATTPRVSYQAPAACAVQRPTPARSPHRARAGALRARRARDRHVASQYFRDRPRPVGVGSFLPQ
ncbi:MAG: hypothetical protein ACRDS0_30050, partial [Pseudonocardiaceae bacterium]